MHQEFRRASDSRSARRRTSLLRAVEPLEPRVVMSLPAAPTIVTQPFGQALLGASLLTFNAQLAAPGPGGAPTTVRIEAPPLNSNFGVNNLYAIVRTGSQPGLIYRIDGASGNINGTGPNGTFQPLAPFSALPPQAIGGSLGTDAPATDPPTGYDNFFDLVFDPTNTTYPGGLFVSTSDKEVLDRNAIYAFDAQGNLLSGSQGAGLPFATFPEQNFPPQAIFDNNPGPLAFGGGGPFGTGLYAQDVTKKQSASGTSGDSNVLFSVAPDGARTVSLNHIEDALPVFPGDFDARGITFGPSTFGFSSFNNPPVIAPSGPLGGDLFEASSDLEETGQSRILQIEKAPLATNPNVFTVNDLLAGNTTVNFPVTAGLYSDIAVEQGINFGGILFATVMRPNGTGDVIQIHQDFTKPPDPSNPLANLVASVFATGFKTRPYTPGDIASEAAAENEAFSVTFSADDQRMYVSDETGIWEIGAAVTPGTLPPSPGGSSSGPVPSSGPSTPARPRPPVPAGHPRHHHSGAGPNRAMLVDRIHHAGLVSTRIPRKRLRVRGG